MKLFHQKVNHYDLRNPYEFSVLVPLKQLLGNGSQATAHAGHVKHILKMLDLLKLLVSVNNRCWVECGIFSLGFLVEGFSVNGWLFFLKCFTFIFLIFKFVLKQFIFPHNLD